MNESTQKESLEQQQKEFKKNFYIREEGYNKYNVSSNNGTELFMDGNKLVNISK